MILIQDMVDFASIGMLEYWNHGFWFFGVKAENRCLAGIIKKGRYNIFL